MQPAPDKPKQKTSPGMLRSSLSVSSGTMASRVLGLVRDVLLARLIGAEAAADAFYVAFKLPNFFRRLFAEGAFNTAFVPVLSDYRKNRELAEVQRFVSHMAAALGLVLLLLTLLVVLFAPQVMTVYAAGFLDDPFKFQAASDMLRITFPYLMLISLTGFAGSILNSYDRFAVPALTPVILNICLILAALYAAPLFEQPVFALAWAVLVAGVLQLIFQLPFLARIHLLPVPKLSFADSGVRRVLKLMVPAMFGVSVSQINLLLDTVLATFLPTGSVSWLYYSDRLMELPLGVFGVAIATVALPNLSRQRFAEDPQGFRNMLGWAMRLVLLIALPATVALMVLATPILASLFQYGAMLASDVEKARFSLAAYALGLLAFMLIKVLATGYFAREDTATPVRIGIIAMAANMVFNLILVVAFHFAWQLGHAGLALATSLSGWLNALLLYRGLRKTDSCPGVAELGPFLWRVLFAVGLMLAGLLALLLVWQDWFAWTAWQRVWRILLLCAVGGGLYLVGLVLTGIRPADFRMQSAD